MNILEQYTDKKSYQIFNTDSHLQNTLTLTDYLEKSRRHRSSHLTKALTLSKKEEQNLCKVSDSHSKSLALLKELTQTLYQKRKQNIKSLMQVTVGNKLSKLSKTSFKARRKFIIVLDKEDFGKHFGELTEVDVLLKWIKVKSAGKKIISLLAQNLNDIKESKHKAVRCIVLNIIRRKLRERLMTSVKTHYLKILKISQAMRQKNYEIRSIECHQFGLKILSRAFFEIRLKMLGFSLLMIKGEASEQQDYYGELREKSQKRKIRTRYFDHMHCFLYQVDDLQGSNVLSFPQTNARYNIQTEFELNKKNLEKAEKFFIFMSKAKIFYHWVQVVNKHRKTDVFDEEEEKSHLIVQDFHNHGSSFDEVFLGGNSRSIGLGYFEMNPETQNIYKKELNFEKVFKIYQ